MIHVLVRKLLRDVAVALALVSLLLFAFLCLWAKVTQTITRELLPYLALRMSLPDLESVLFQGPGKLLQALAGGEAIDITRAAHMMSIAYVHPLVQTILCVWAVGRASGAVAGELDRGTMELLLAQPVPRRNLILAHLCVDWLTIPVLCLSVWGGTWVGTWLVGFQGNSNGNLNVEPLRFGAGLFSSALLVFAVSGSTICLSACGRFRWRAMGAAVLLTLVQFLVNVIGQLWEPLAPLRAATVFYYYQPQPMILQDDWYALGEVWLRLGVLFGVGAAGYLLGLWVFCRRDLPAPL